MRILFVTTAHNSLSQRLQVELTSRGHGVVIQLATGDEVMTSAVKEHRPDLHSRADAEAGDPPRDLEPSHLLRRASGHQGRSRPFIARLGDYRDEESWGVTVLEADAGMDTGPIWATEEFDMSPRPLPKSSLYRGAVTEAAVRAVLAAVERFQRRDYVPEALDYSRPDVKGMPRPQMKQADRAIDWSADSTAQSPARSGRPTAALGCWTAVFSARSSISTAHTKRTDSGDRRASSWLIELERSALAQSTELSG